MIIFGIDTSAIDEAQKKADKLKVTLLEVQELIRKNNSIIADVKEVIFDKIKDAINRSLECSRFTHDFSKDAEK